MASYLFEISYTLVTVSILCYFLSRSFLKHTKKELVMHWMLFGFFFSLYSFSWLYTVYPLPWMQKGILQILGITIVHLLISIISGLSFFVVAYSSHKKIKKIFLPVTFAFTLMFAEILKSLALSTLFYGKGGTIALHFTASTLGNALSSTPFIEFAYFGGTFALTFILGYLMYIFQSKKHFFDYGMHGVVIAFLLFCIHFFIPVTLPAPETRVGIVTTNFKAPTIDNYDESFRRQALQIHALTLSLVQASSTIIVYPEDSRYIAHLPPQEMADLYIMFNKTLFLDGDTILTKDGLSNISFFYYPRGNKRIGRGKDFLLPFNEYVPVAFSTILTPFIGKKNMDTYEKMHTFTSVHSRKTILFETTRIGTILCSEIFSFSTIQNIRKEKPSIVFFQSQLEVFHNNPWSNMHLRSITKVAAAQLRTPLISSSNNAPSFIVTPYGKIVRVIPASMSTTTYTFTQ